MHPDLICGNFIFYSSVVFRTEILKETRFSATIRRSMDWLFFTELSKNGNFRYLEEPTSYYRIHGNNLQNIVATSAEKTQAVEFILDKYKSEIPRTFRSKFNYIIAREKLRHGKIKEARLAAFQSLILNPISIKKAALVILTIFNIKR